MRVDDESAYREGLVVDRPVKKGQGSYVNAGLRKEVQVDRNLKAGIRVTVRIDSTGKDSFLPTAKPPSLCLQLHLKRQLPPGRIHFVKNRLMFT